MLGGIRGALPEEAEYYRKIYLDGYSKNIQCGDYDVREAVDASAKDEDTHLRSEYWSVNNSEEGVQAIWEKTFLKATLRHQVTEEKRHDHFCQVAAKITRIMVEEDVQIKHPSLKKAQQNI